MDDQRLTIKQKAYALLLCSVVFAVVYNASMWHVSSLPNVQSFVFDFEKNIPFLIWTIVPYMTSGVFLCLIFLLCKTKKQLHLLTKRMLFITVVAGLCFVIFPLRFLMPKPDVSQSFLGFSFHFLEIFDSPFNQSPSLHIAYAYVFWTIFRTIKGNMRTFLMLWLILLGISTLTTYQHHFLDILTGSILAHLSFIVFPEGKNEFEFRNFQVANYYFLCAWFLALISLLLAQFYGMFWLALLWPALVMMIVGYQYQKNHVGFLKDQSGKIAFYKRIFYLPYLIIYWILVISLRKNRRPVEILPRLFISSRLDINDLKYFKPDERTTVYDLSAEIEENPEIRKTAEYFSFPYLDIGTFDIAETRKLVTHITEKYSRLPDDGKILIHCTMGYTRCTVIATLVMKNILSLPTDEAITKIKSLHRNYILHPYAADFLKKINL
ncbi:MAG: phosphatase PAP2 family protein [Chryseobacterium sp.]|nr:MAG: phosphatase PAP2 family protein [Chryseobacterium sp.]